MLERESTRGTHSLPTAGMCDVGIFAQFSSILVKVAKSCGSSSEVVCLEKYDKSLRHEGLVLA